MQPLRYIAINYFYFRSFAIVKNRVAYWRRDEDVDQIARELFLAVEHSGVSGGAKCRPSTGSVSRPDRLQICGRCGAKKDASAEGLSTCFHVARPDPQRGPCQVLRDRR